ncbi:fanconi-associated nuclease 1 homolog isoform X2 [Salvia miltiorrhiza]|uniref:fanconi-associated nuclease 1 homolog isoform X2 n=1 Tax=Salvia miltiorrhiza TaxID=226208 RepID=UPI0025AC03E5|nr:fanconi-associated nuclease 1 homolog isoform X2 [Salvia miltiorrhiza]
MLTGRESLLRVIGKRRRFLPSRRSVLYAAAASPSPSCSSIWERDEMVERDSAQQRPDGDGDAPESVNCPVCGARLPGADNALINSHVDDCLAPKGSKRKLSQVTLFQLNFSRSKARLHSSRPANDRVTPDGVSTADTVHNSSGLDGSDEYANNDSAYLGNVSNANPEEDFISKGTNSDKFALPLFLSDIEEGHKDGADEFSDDYDMSKVVIPTLIVGRRYGSRESIDPQSRLCLSRDPENVKDPNAIKVLCVDCGSDRMLGYIPRELAQYLSPLIEKFHLNFEGSITSVPQDPRASIPIQIVCTNVELCDQKYCNGMQEFKTLWIKALRVVELAKSNPSGMTRYQRNLELLIQEVLKSNRHLFTDSEVSFLGPWFRMSSMSYPEIADHDQALKGLVEAGYLCSFLLRNDLEEDDLEEAFNILNVDELREALLLINKKCSHGTRKQGIIKLLLSSNTGGPCSDLRGFVLAKTGSCVKVSPLAELLVWRAERLFFLNGEQDLSAFLLVDLGIVKYPAYRCIISEPIFPNRSGLLSYEEAIEISQIMIESLDENNLELVLRCIEISVSCMSTCSKEHTSSTAGSMDAFLSHFSASWVYSKVVLLGVSFLEREKRYKEAINLLRRLLNAFISDRRRGYWTLRLSVDLEHLGRIDDSLQVAEDGLLDPWVRAGSRVALQRRVLRLGKPPRRWKIPNFSNSVNRKIFQVHVQGKPLNCKIGAKSIFYGENGERCGVEELALQYYAGDGGGWQGVHTESGIWLTIFGILMWDIIFADVPNVFRTKFQTAPLDLETDSFYETRKSLIEAHLEKIRDGMAEEILITTWDLHVGTTCRGVNWEKHSLADLRAAAKCIGGACLASICRHLAQGYRSWSSGMPDLLLWRLEDCYRGEAKLVEVKGPRDRLSEQQRAWLLILIDCGFTVEVCKVTPNPVAT